MTHRTLLAVVFCALALPQAVFAQVLDASQLQVDIENHRLYVLDVDRSQLAKSAAPVNRAAPSTFETWFGIGDIVAVNGNPVKGSILERGITISTSPTTTPGQAIADVIRRGIYEWNLEFLNPDGSPLGAILVRGLAGGSPPPGAPAAIDHGGFVVVGGTGAFQGVRGGYFQNTPDPSTPIQIASAAEDPAYRRVNGGFKARSTLYLISQWTPQVVMTGTGPAVAHPNDFTLVTSSKPAAPGEVLALYATGLGPTRQSMEPGQGFPMQPPAGVAAPVSVTVNGTPAEVLAAVGYPGATDGYQVNFRVPSGVASGQATLRVSSAWIFGPAVKIPIQ